MNQLNFSDQMLQFETPVLDEVAEDYRDRMRVVKVNVEQELQITRQWGVKIGASPFLINHDSAGQITFGQHCD